MKRHLTQMLQQQTTPHSIRGMELFEQEMKWQQQQQQLNFMINDNNHMNMYNLPIQGGMNKQGTDMGSGWDAYGVGDMNSAIPRTISCPPAVAAAMAEEVIGGGREGICMATKLSAIGKESMNKRKLDRTQSLQVEVEIKDKKMKGCIEDVGAKMITEKQSNSYNSNKEPSADNSQENSKVSEVRKPDYIHVRARRGQATDSHSLAERVRREKISERMKFLQDLVPGCNKIIGKAGMLDEIINYVQSLQRQVEFLSMKLANVNPKLDYDIENLLNEEAPPATTNEFSTIGLPSSMVNPGNLQFNPLLVPCSGRDANDSQDMALCRTMSTPVSLPETLLNQSYLNQIQQAPAWDVDLENLYVMEFQHEKLSSSFTQPFTGYIEANQVKLEM